MTNTFNVPSHEAQATSATTFASLPDDTDPDGGVFESLPYDKADDDGPEVWIGCLASRNRGDIFGHWIDADQAADELQSAIADMLAESPIEGADEWYLGDSSGFHGIAIEEFPSLVTLALLARNIVEHGEAFAAYAKRIDCHLPTEDDFLNCYIGDWPSPEAWAEEVIELTIFNDDTPDACRAYFDFGRWARDKERGGEFRFVEGTSGRWHVFALC